MHRSDGIHFRFAKYRAAMSGPLRILRIVSRPSSTLGLLHRLSISVLFFAFTACDIPTPFLDDMTREDVCDPAYNMYLGDRHFIERDFVTRDGNIDFNRYLEISKPQASPCDPLYNMSEAERRAEFEKIFSVLRKQ